jgi:hypothetical protein
VLVGLLAALVALGGVHPTPAGASPEDAPTLGMIGDSIPFQGLWHFDKTIKRDRRVVLTEIGLGYKIRTVLPDVRRSMRSAEPPDIFLAFIGTSSSETDAPATWRRELTQLMDTVSPVVDCIRVFEIDDENTGFYAKHDRNARTFNRLTHQIVGRYDNAEWYHYERWAELAGPEYERPDILHHNGAGQVQIARLMRSVVSSCDPAMTTGPYWDVPDRFPAAEAIRWVGERGLFPGYPNGTYRATIGGFVIDATRGQFVNMAWRLAGRPAGFDPHPWSDGQRSVNRALRWAAGTRVGTGFPNGTYRPGSVVTRGQAINLLWRMAGRPGGYPDDPWSDAAGAAFRWAAATQVLDPLAPGRFGPKTGLTRAETATVLQRFDALPD